MASAYAIQASRLSDGPSRRCRVCRRRVSSAAHGGPCDWQSILGRSRTHGSAQVHGNRGGRRSVRCRRSARARARWHRNRRDRRRSIPMLVARSRRRHRHATTVVADAQTMRGTSPRVRAVPAALPPLRCHAVNRRCMRDAQPMHSRCVAILHALSSRVEFCMSWVMGGWDTSSGLRIEASGPNPNP